jgi:hypothetical protein
LEPKEIKSFKKFLKLVEENLKAHSIEKLTTLMTEALTESQATPTAIEDVIQVVCSDYKITKAMLLKSRMRGPVQEARHICFCLLHFDLGYHMRFIAFKVFYIFPNAVFVGIKKYKTINPNIANDREFMERYLKLSAVVREKNNKDPNKTTDK